MIYSPEKKEIVLNRELSSLDRFVIDFCRLLSGKYVIVSGYVSILLGRSRATDDVDLLVPKMNYMEFERLWEKMHENGFECLTHSNPKEAFDMLKEIAIRFCVAGAPRPNIEFKMIKTDLDEYSLENRIHVVIGNNVLFISPLEAQIAYKLFLAADGTDEELTADKDIEDARHLYKFFSDKINKEDFLDLVDKLNVKKRLRWLQ